MLDYSKRIATEISTINAQVKSAKDLADGHDRIGSLLKSLLDSYCIEDTLISSREIRWVLVAPIVDFCKRIES